MAEGFLLSCLFVRFIDVIMPNGKRKLAREGNLFTKKVFLDTFFAVE